MAGSITVTPAPIPPNRAAARHHVFRYDPAGSGTFTRLPNVRCQSVSRREWEPGSARLRYVLDQQAGPQYPRAFEQLLPLEASGPYVVAVDDRIVVGLERPDGSLKLIFDGLAQLPEVDYGPQGEQVTVQCLGLPVREWDLPIAGALYRDADDPTALRDIETDLPVRFNPDGRPNATPESVDTVDPDDSLISYPVFIDPLVVQSDPGQGRLWDLGMAVRYLIARGNPEQEFVGNQLFGSIDTLVSAIVPAEGYDAVDLDDGASWTYEPITAQDLDCTGMAWPEAVRALIEPHGFGLDFRVTGATGVPEWYWVIYRKDDVTWAKSPKLQPAGSAFAPAQTEVGALRLVRDAAGLANRIEVDTEVRHVEASFVLACVDEPDEADAATDAATKNKWIAGNEAFVYKYRKWIVNEAGDQECWDPRAEQISSAAPALGDLFSSEEAKQHGDIEAPKVRAYVRRRRPGLERLFSRDDKETSLRAQLWAAKLDDYDGPIPGLWDGDTAVKWQRIESGWRLLDDRLGIEITATDLEDWATGKARFDGQPFPKLSLRAVYQTCRPDSAPDVAANPRFVLRLTCVIESDQGLGARAERRVGSPVSREITRRIDDRGDRFRRETISGRSHLSATPGGADLDARDDTTEATRYAEAQRRASEMAVLAGTLAIPRVSLAYEVGDKLERIAGRDASLRTSAAGQAGESPQYPSVIGIDWTLDGGNQTVLILQDRRAEAPR